MGFLSRIFNRQEKLLEPADIGQLQVDVHSHLIPGIDDGSTDMEETLTMLRKFHELGYRKVITTPHVMSDFYRNTPTLIQAGLEEVREAIRTEEIDIEIEAAAEYYLDDVFEELLERDEVLTFGSGRYLLFELPFIAEPANLSRAIFNMQLKEYKPVLAHPERYSFWFRDFEKFEELNDKGVILQVNANSLSGYYGPEVKKVADHLLEKGLIRMLGTDCHRMEHLEAFESITCRMPSFHRLLEEGNLLNREL
ncbi:MAG: capsular biosynthesis protein [Flavobacteriales bacterium]|nr:capsular biosynthesis protein [Flavobacteriales bacterium]